ncbi:MAG TPA: protein-glutamate O-methyltransferase CheR [Thermodesulfobacteriota bacterium]|nr:protein-glutamate O-methyltransferase CheR [Thermodesulfobacteriota bacterium]
MALRYCSHDPLECTETDFHNICRLVYDQSGINLQEGKQELVKARLGKRIRHGNFRSFREYYDFVVNDSSGEELIQLLDSISTNFTHFFRENQHFDYLRTELIPFLRTAKGRSKRKIRVWSAGCSTGEEPYTIAITLLEAKESYSDWEPEILATDISTKVLNSAQSGIYSCQKVQSLSREVLKKYFLRGDNQWRDFVKVKPEVKRAVTFRRFNLMGSLPEAEPFDCIFCRNVMIYFDKETRNALIQRFYNHLEKEGVLFIGHSESLTGMKHSFQYVRPAIYKK